MIPDSNLVPSKLFTSDLVVPINSMTKLARRNLVLNIEEGISKLDNAVFGNAYPLKHTFSDGIYVRELTMPANTIMTGKIHKHQHPYFILKGTVRVITEEGGVEDFIAPVSMISPKGAKRAFYTLTEVILTTVHLNPTNTQDIDELEEKLVVDTYKQYDDFIQRKLPWYKRVIKLISVR